MCGRPCVSRVLGQLGCQLLNYLLSVYSTVTTFSTISPRPGIQGTLVGAASGEIQA